MAAYKDVIVECLYIFCSGKEEQVPLRCTDTYRFKISKLRRM